ncbi:hypothetical protein BLAT2472_11288 [Burkholderia latens]
MRGLGDTARRATALSDDSTGAFGLPLLGLWFSCIPVPLRGSRRSDGNVIRSARAEAIRPDVPCFTLSHALDDAGRRNAYVVPATGPPDRLQVLPGFTAGRRVQCDIGHSNEPFERIDHACIGGSDQGRRRKPLARTRSDLQGSA